MPGPLEPGTMGVSMGEIAVWDGAAWRRLSATGRLPKVGDPVSVGFDPETVGMPPGDVLLPDDGSGDDGETYVPWQVLLESLLCRDCDMELSATACNFQHAFLADHPEQHPDVSPLLARYLAEARIEERKCLQCTPTSTETVAAVGLATGDCPHLDIRVDQVRMSREEWNRLVLDRDAETWRTTVPTLGGAKMSFHAPTGEISSAALALLTDGHGHHIAIINEGRTLLCSDSGADCLLKNPISPFYKAPPESPVGS